ncbi:MAG: Galactose oxidase [Parcubacteria group bacterium GW2011_GWA2_48_9]|nr:MAG: Galactose oxidase [Parcubacteria group bacterium GW2011_GWA2_48_9]
MGDGQRMQPGVTWDCAHYGLGAPNGNDGEQQWAWYKKHRNVFMVLSGHMDTTGYLKGMGDSGNDIHQMLSDYQSYGNGGNGYLRIIRFSPQTNTVNIKTYSPTLNQYIPAHEYQFDFFPYDSFKAEYYNNKDMSGVPAYTTTVSTINSDWGNSTPHPAVTSDRFSARWTGYWDLNAGQYNFIMTTDDGMRVYVDGELITGLDKWFDQAETTYVVPVTIANSGRHEIYVEYYEDLGTAKARLYWTNVPDTLAPILSNLSPFSGATSVSANTNISLHVTDSAYGVDKSSLGMTVNGSAVTPVVTGTPSDYLIVYNPPSDFTSPQNVQVHIEAQDLAGNTLSQSYSFQVGCVPACIGKVCGSDGCGGSCGDCSAGTICSGESCVPCTPNCTGKICGSNGCGGSCGSCSSEMSCSAGQCITNPSGGGIIKPCFLAGTSIGLAYGGTKPIEQIAVGDEVVSFDEMSQTFQKSMVKELFVHETDYYLVINNFINVTPNHAVYSGGKWVPIGDLIVGDTIYSSGEKALTIISIEKVEAPVTVYNFEAYPYHTYIADGIVAHNALGKKPPAE